MTRTSIHYEDQRQGLMRIIFAGTPEVAVPTLQALVAAGHDVCAVVTRPDAPLGRKRILTPSPVALAALDLGIPVIRASRIDAAVSAELTALQADLGVVVAFGGLLPAPALAATPQGWINLHFSTLPRWRGAAPVQWSIIAGDTSVGTTVFSLVAELDAGDIYSAEILPIGPDESAGELLSRLASTGADQVCRVVLSIENGTALGIPQSGDPTYARKLSLEDGHLDFHASAIDVYARLRGVTPEPGAFVELAGEHLKILGAALPEDAPHIAAGHIESHFKRIWLGTGTTALELIQVQPAGRARMPAPDWFRGLHNQESIVLS